ncbi:RRQRL motif-containing zinc-binding protein [Longispora sp. NPDC051575]|uniref:RRQRL motif-containing zinc-binding protein n=1 Tax=Longispora sp. NPDC051575 TaxID=3154943 RepID=UPI0034131587
MVAPTRYRAKFYDPNALRHSVPTFPWESAPAGYATVRQLRAMQLRPGGQDIAAQILWPSRGTVRVAYLYRVDLAKPKRTATPAQLRAIRKALLCRRICPTCSRVRPYYIRRSLGECARCAGQEN